MSIADTTAPASTSAKSAILSRMSFVSGSVERQTSTSGAIPIRRSSFTECCVGFVFSSPALAMNGHERDVDVEDVVGADLAAELADRLEERLRLDVADRPADLRDDDVGGARLRDRADPRLDLVRDVRDHLHRRAEVLALALLAQHAVPDAAGRVVRGAREVLVDEALVVADVEIGLGAVLGDEHLAVLERAHRARDRR